MAVADDLQRVPLFADLNQRQLRQLAKDVKERGVKAGTQLVKEGEMSGVDCFVIKEGEAAITVGGKEIARIGPDDYFGELALVSERERTASVVALTPMRCYTIQFWAFRRFAKKNPDVTWTLLQHVTDLLLEERARAQAAQAFRASA